MAEADNLIVINFTNINDQDFTGKWAGQDYLIKAGETKPYPTFLANHFAKQLAQKIFIRDGKDFSDEILLKPLVDKMIGNTSAPVAEPVAPIIPAEPEFVEAPKEEAIPAPVVEPTGENPFKCEVCGRVCKNKVGLIAHSRSHK